jgi:hypothetical protein
LSHAAPVLGVTAQFGGGARDVAIAGELLYERMLGGLDAPSQVSFQLFGVGFGGSYYLRDDWFLTAHVRWVGLYLWMNDVPCFCDRIDATWGPGLGLTAGKEWFRGKRGGLGVALQVNYARLRGAPALTYASGLALFTLTRF